MLSLIVKAVPVSSIRIRTEPNARVSAGGDIVVSVTLPDGREIDVGGIKQGGDWFNADQPSMSRLYGSKSPQRKAASAMIAKIPLPLSRHIGATYYPGNEIT